MPNLTSHDFMNLAIVFAGKGNINQKFDMHVELLYTGMISEMSYSCCESEEYYSV